MKEHELWITGVFNQYLSGPANAVLNAIGAPAHDPHRPWANWMAIELIVFVILIVLFAILKPRLSVDRPGKLQHLFEVLYGFLKNSTQEVGIHHGKKYVGYFGTLFIFILFMNLIGVIPGLESPTMSPSVPAGLAICTFLYYNFMGMRELGVGSYLAHFMGPIPALAPVMVPIEIVSHLARPLSLTMFGCGTSDSSHTC